MGAMRIAPMDTKHLRSMVPMAPLPLRPILSALLDWMARTDARLAAMERPVGRSMDATSPPPASNH